MRTNLVTVRARKRRRVKERRGEERRGARKRRKDSRGSSPPKYRMVTGEIIRQEKEPKGVAFRSQTVPGSLSSA